MDILINIDVPDIEAGIRFYRDAFGFTLARRLGAGIAELAGGPAPLFLLEKPEGSVAAAQARRRYGRHWTPVHLDIVVGDVATALAAAVAAGATPEGAIRTEAWGRLAICADPFGHGFCLIAFTGGYGVLETA
jgi:predicted enzyme related to lactoylglutathione lyase